MSFDSVNYVAGGVLAPLGFVGKAVKAGIKDPAKPRLDMALIYSRFPTTSAATFTTNQVQAAPVKLSQSHLQVANMRAIVANSGNANACTGLQGVRDASLMCERIASGLELAVHEVGVCSTGVIGLPLPMSRVEPGLAELLQDLDSDSGTDIAKAIMTSDTTHKELAVEFMLGDKAVRIGACAKGAGMICPNMATMLCFITTDANIGRELLQTLVLDAVENSFNRISIDGDMSTNDSVLVLANAASGCEEIVPRSKECRLFAEALGGVMLCLAKRIVQDGERVTKFVSVRVQGARTPLDARKVAEAVAKSSLVKASWNGEDPNWGRIIHAVGYSRAKIYEELIDIDIAGLSACRGGVASNTPADELREAVKQKEFEVRINLNQGRAEYIVYTTDLSPEYVDFNRNEYAYWNQAKKDGLAH